MSLGIDGGAGRPAEGGRKESRRPPAALLMHSSLMGRAGPEMEKDVPNDTQQLRLDLDLERSRGNEGEKQSEKQRDGQIG